PHGELCSRLADGLGRDDAHGLADAHESPPCEVSAVAEGAHAPSRSAREDRADPDCLVACFVYLRQVFFPDLFVPVDDDLSVRFPEIFKGNSSEDPCPELFDHLTAFD